MREKTLTHQYLEILNRRGGATEDEIRQLQALEVGYEGEVEFDRWPEKYGSSDWVVYKDLWLSANGTTQIDTLVITPAGIFIFDVKNYFGEAVYENGQMIKNSQRMRKDIFVQLRRSLEIVDIIHGRIGSPGMLEASIVFVNEHFIFENKDDSIRMKYVMRNEIYKKLQSMKNIENMKNHIDMSQTCNMLDEFIIDNPYLPNPLNENRYVHLAKGIHCVKCNSSDIHINRFHVDCKCGYQEGKSKAILRTICEFGVLNFHRDITAGDLAIFFNGQLSYRHICKVLKDSFTRVPGRRYAKYQNSGKSYEFLFGHREYRYKDGYVMPV